MPVGVILRAFLLCLKNPIKIPEKSRQRAAGRSETLSPSFPFLSIIVPPARIKSNKKILKYGIRY